MNFTLERLSFWVGFLSGALAAWLLSHLIPLIGRLWQNVRRRVQTAGEELTVGIETRHRNHILQQAQRLHLAAPLFSLDEILIEPRLLAPPVAVQPGQDTPTGEVATQLIPYLPDWPELAAAYHAPTLSLTQALSAGANLILMGRPGSGKTVALAHLAGLVARQDAKAGDLTKYVPILLHAADLPLPLKENAQPLDILIDVVAERASALSLPRLPAFLRQVFAEQRGLLLLDGLDELPPVDIQEAVAFLEILLKQYPALRLVVAASLESYRGLNKLGLIPVAMAAWGSAQRLAFLQTWGDLWEKYLQTDSQSQTEAIDSAILKGWLLSESPAFTPLEYTLKVWAAFAGDALGSGGSEALEAYLRRMSSNLPEGRAALEKLALQMIVSLRPIVTPKDAREWIGEPETSAVPETAPANGEPVAQKSGKAPAAAGRIQASTLDSDLLITHPGGHLTFIHPVISAQLAAAALARTGSGEALRKQPEWVGKSLTLQSLATLKDVSLLANPYLESKNDPLYRKPLAAASWLSRGSKNAAWRSAAMRTLIGILRREDLSMGLRARVLTILATSGEAGVNTLFRQLLADSQAEVRQLSALGCGLLREAQATDELIDLLNDPVPTVAQAAVFALEVIGDKAALEGVASALLHGDEELRRAAAEALAGNPAEGYPLLKEAILLDDLLVRRAAVYGLARVGEPWAIQILEKMSVEDAQWVVKNAALQAVEATAHANPHIPYPRQPLSETPWLIAFAGEQGLGLSSGKAATTLLFQALREGNEEQRLAALEELRLRGDERAIPPLYDLLESSHGVVREVAFNALWHLAVSGVELPPST